MIGNIVGSGNVAVVNGRVMRLPSGSNSVSICGDKVFVNGKLWTGEKRERTAPLQKWACLKEFESRTYQVNGADRINIVKGGDKLSVETRFDAVDSEKLIMNETLFDTSLLDVDNCEVTLTIPSDMKAIRISGGATTIISAAAPDCHVQSAGGVEVKDSELQSLTAHNGATAEGSTLQRLSVQTGSGQVCITNCNVLASCDIRTGSGSVSLARCKLRGEATVKTGSGIVSISQVS